MPQEVLHCSRGWHQSDIIPELGPAVAPFAAEEFGLTLAHQLGRSLGGTSQESGAATSLLDMFLGLSEGQT